MNQFGAMEDTIALMEQRLLGPQGECMPRFDDVGYLHLREMLEQMRRWGTTEPPASPAKMGRWLGWAQCAVRCGKLATLEEMKQINRRRAGEDDVHTS